ncbi:MAG: hypothetical protein LH473_13385 [Chitinophagales bacterium]|nr:hypothetical protein [Chitinophagales bacterium]
MNDVNTTLSSDEFIEQIITEQVGSSTIINAVGYSSSYSGTIPYCSTNPTLGNADVFVAKFTLNAGTVTKNWLTFIGSDGSGNCSGCDNYDWGYCMALDHDGANTFLYVAGNNLGASSTYSIPSACVAACNTSPYQSARKDSWDAFLAKLDASNESITAWTYFGGTSNNGTEKKDIIMGLAIKPGTLHDVYAVGYTESAYTNQLCTSCGATVWDNSNNGAGDAFIAAFDKCPHTLKYFTFYNVTSGVAAIKQGSL